MNHHEIRTITEPSVDELQCLSADLLARAQSLLGYKPASHGFLRDTLADLGIQELDPEDVKRYKSQVRWENIKHLLTFRPSKIRRWERVRISLYKGAVPQHVLNYACDLVERLLPTQPRIAGEISVCFLATKDESAKYRSADPFLCVYDEVQRAVLYIAVWDETDFERNIHS